MKKLDERGESGEADMIECGRERRGITTSETIRVWSCGCLTPHVGLGSMRPPSQCVGGMLSMLWCFEE